VHLPLWYSGCSKVFPDECNVTVIRDWEGRALDCWCVGHVVTFSGHKKNPPEQGEWKGFSSWAEKINPCRKYLSCRDDPLMNSNTRKILCMNISEVNDGTHWEVKMGITVQAKSILGRQGGMDALTAVQKH